MIYAYAIVYWVIASGMFGMLVHYAANDPNVTNDPKRQHEFKGIGLLVLALWSLLWPLLIVAGIGYCWLVEG